MHGWGAGLRARRGRGGQLQPHLEQRYDDAVLRAADLEQLQRIAAISPSRTQFLTDLTLDPPSATSDEAGPPLLRDEDYLILSTIHSAKGQEWKAVFVLNVVDGCIPSDMATGKTEEIEEERRLLYVAMTRAKDQLALIVPHRFYKHGQSRTGDQHLYASRSRFIPASVAGSSRCAHGPRPHSSRLPPRLATPCRSIWPPACVGAGARGPRRADLRPTAVLPRRAGRDDRS